MFSTYCIGKTISLAALLGVLAAIPAVGQLVQDPPPELSFLSTILSQEEHSLRDLGRSKVPKRGRSIQTGQALVHLGRNRERYRSRDGMEQDQAGVPAERLDPLQRISGMGIAGGAAIREGWRAGLGQRGYRRLAARLSPGRDRNLSAAFYSDAHRACGDARENRDRYGRFSVFGAAPRIEISSRRR
jgi:hypothetical protein